MTSIKPDQITFPIDTIQAQLKIEGIYSIPDEWKTTDEANPGLFTYTVRMSKFELLKGKVAPRQLTQKEKREQQQKNKKGGKKDSKNPQPNQQQEKFKKAEQQRQRQRQQLFAKLSQEEQFYHTAQDIYRSPFLKFQENNSSVVFKGNECLIFEQRLLKNKGDWIYIYKLPAVSEDQLAKMRKSKPKTLNNINDLNPVVMRAWVNFEQLSSANDKIQLKQLRCKITQVDKTPQTSQPNLERTYIKISFTLNEPIIKEKDSYSTSSLIADPQKPKEVLPEIKCLEQMKEELALAVESLAMEYSTMFWKEINMQQQQRNSQIYLNNKKGQLTKRKEQFLYDFNVTGKYKILKDRIKKCIVHLCQTKYKDFFAGMKSFNGIKCNNQDQIYSQIYNLLVTSYQETLFKIIHEKEQSLGEILILNNGTIKQERQHLLGSYKDETVIDRVNRTIKEYEVLQNFGYGESLIQKYIQEYPELTELKYLYGTYCLKFNLKPAKELLPYIEEYLTKQKFTLTDDKKAEFMLILFNIGGENNLKGWIILREIIQAEIRLSQVKPSQNISKWLLLASVILKNMGNSQLSSKYKSFALREYKKYLGSFSSQGSQSVQGNHKESPQKSQIPSINGVANYLEVGSSQQLNKLFDGLIELLNKFSAFEVIKRILAEKSSGSSEEQSSEQTEITLDKALPEINELLVSHSEEALVKLLNLTQKIYQKTSLSGTTQQKNTILEFILKAYLLKLQSSPNKHPQDLTALQTYLKKCIMNNNQPFSRFTSLLRLGYVYCQKKQYGNARACLLKYLEKAHEFPDYLSGLSYKLLGIACIKSGRVNEAIENFKHWNLSDPKNKNSWLYLALGFAQSKQIIAINQCLTQYKKRSQDQTQTEQQSQVLSQISQLVGNLNSCGQYQTVIKDKIVQAIAC